MRLALLLTLLCSCLGPKADGDSAAPDADGDGYPAPEDCDDGDSTVYPGATERCDGKDGDCDGATDEDAADATLWYSDADGDGHGDPARAALRCEPASGEVADSTDCDDSAAEVYPGAAERCDGRDNDCDGAADEDPVDPSVWYSDADGDGYGDPASSATACTAPGGSVADNTDCDDSDAARSPGAPELCNTIDDDCDGAADESDAADAAQWYADADSDGYGDPSAGVPACEEPPGFVPDNTDCDDSEASVHPEAPELCGGGDEDCDGAVDESTAEDAPTWYADADADGYGDGSQSQRACGQPGGFVADSTDCDDGAAGSNPGAPERCGGGDEDCDAAVDESTAIDAQTWYADADADGYGDAGQLVYGCTQPSGAVVDTTDCDDSESGVYPGATEYCWSGHDEDCDGNAEPCSRFFPAFVSDEADVTITGVNTRDYAGHHLSIGDINQDGISDVAVSSFANGGAGAVHVMTGPFQDGDTVGSAAYTFTGATDLAGFYGTEIVDMDGSGIPDLVVAAPYSSRNSIYPGGGAVFLFSDPALGTTPETSAMTVWMGGQTGWCQAGYSIAALPDQNGDGARELAIAAPCFGRVAVVSGADTGSLDLENSYQTLLTGTRALGGPGAYQISAAQDVTGDGMADLIVADTDIGGFRVVPGPMPVGALSIADVAISVSNLPSLAHAHSDRMIDAGDLDGDGYRDAIVVAQIPNSFYIFLGPLLADITYGDAYGQVRTVTAPYFSSVATGDFDGSGDLDIAAGVTDIWEFYYGNSYSVTDELYIFLDLPQGVVYDYGDAQITQDSGAYVVDLTTIPDYDGDGDDELILGAPGWGGVASLFGAVQIFQGEVY